jgi:hypothetical protein
MLALNFITLPEWESVANYIIVSVLSGRENDLDLSSGVYRLPTRSLAQTKSQ